MDDKIVGQTCAVIEKEHSHTHLHIHMCVHIKKTNIYIYIYVCVCVYITIFQSGSSINKAQARKQFIKSSLETRPLRGIELIKAAAKSQ